MRSCTTLLVASHINNYLQWSASGIAIIEKL